MKSLLPILALVSFSAFARSEDNCADKASEYVRAVTEISYGTELSDQIEYRIDNTEVDGRAQKVTVTAFGTGGEDSDTYDQYEVVLDKFGNRCFSLISMTLVGQN